MRGLEAKDASQPLCVLPYIGRMGGGRHAKWPITPPLGGKMGVMDDERGEDDVTIVFSVKNHA